jgi:hypothetical protein
MLNIFMLSTIITLLALILLYNHIGLNKIKKCMLMWSDSSYWIPTYNKVEFAAWFSKAIIIFPGLLFEKQIWWLFIISLLTSSLLIWVSMKKLLPTLIAFNSLWIFISVTAITKHFME